MKPFYWGTILTSIVIVASVTYLNFRDGNDSPPAPASIEKSAEQEPTPPKPEIPELNSFEGLQEELNSLNGDLAPSKNAE